MLRFFRIISSIYSSAHQHDFRISQQWSHLIHSHQSDSVRIVVLRRQSRTRAEAVSSCVNDLVLSRDMRDTRGFQFWRVRDLLRERSTVPELIPRPLLDSDSTSLFLDGETLDIFSPIVSLRTPCDGIEAL
jgi:hypothetical protein